MNVVVVALGTRGDVLPAVSVAAALARRGHPVAVATHGAHRRSVESAGLPLRPIDPGPEAFFQEQAGRDFAHQGHSLWRALRAVREVVRPLLARWGTEAERATRDAEALLFTPMATDLALSLAERRRARAAGLFCYPALFPTGDFPSPLSPVQRDLGRLGNRLTHAVVDAARWLPVRGEVSRWRQDQLGLGPAGWTHPRELLRRGLPVLFGFSEHVVPRPADWGPAARVCGYWPPEVEPGWQLPAPLERFLAEGPRPVFVGFGDQPLPDPPATTRAVLEALRQSGQRGVVLQGAQGLAPGELPDGVMAVEPLPFFPLFSRMAAVIHHGGAGTSGLGLRAGVPTGVVPFFNDQFFWGQRVHALGVGPPPLPFRHLTAERLAAVIRAVAQDEGLGTRAARLGSLLRSEDGVERAVAHLEEMVLY